MTAEQAHTLFDQLYDRYGSNEGVTSFEKSTAINTAQVLVMKNFFHPQKDRAKNSIHKDPLMAFEETNYTSEDFQNIIYSDLTATSSVTGIVSKASLSGTFPLTTTYAEDGSIIEQKTTEIFHILDVARYSGGDFQSTRFVRHHHLRQMMNNGFTTPDELNPVYLNDKDGYRLVPTGSRNVKVSLVRFPILSWWMPEVGISVDPELSDSIMYDIILRAVKIASVGVSDSEKWQFIDREQENS